MISPQAQYFLPYMPLPNSVQGSTSYAAVTNNLLQNETRGDVRIDEQITNSTQLSGRYSINQNNENDPNPYPAMGTFALESRAQNPTVSLTHIFTPNLLNVARFSYYRSYFYFGAALPGTNFNQEAGVQGFNDTTSLYSFPEISLSGYSTYTGSPYDQRPKQNRIRDFQYADDLTYTVGRHTLKFGGELIHADAGFINGSDSVGIFSFNGEFSGDAFADYLLGYPYSVTRDYFKQLNGDYGNFWGFYAQDSFRVRPDLTLNLGVRLDLQGFYNGIRGQKSAFDLQTGQLIIPSSIDPQVQLLTPTLMQLFGDRIQYTKSLGLPDSIQSAQQNWAPRIGFAWRPGNSANLVVRSSFGTFYVFPDSNTINNTVATVPFIAGATVFNNAPPSVPTRTWANFFLGEPNVSANSNPGQPCSFGFVANSCVTPNVDSGNTTFIAKPCRNGTSPFSGRSRPQPP